MLMVAGAAGAQVPLAQTLPAPADPAPAPQDDEASPADETKLIRFSADHAAYDSSGDTVTVTGNVQLNRASDRLRADKVVWNRKTGIVTATGNVVVSNPAGDQLYGDTVELTDTLKDGMIENLLIVLDRGARLAAEHGERRDEIVTLTQAAYAPCSPSDTNNCPTPPSWTISAARIVYDPHKRRVYFYGGHIEIFGVVSLPLPAFSSPVGSESRTGLLAADLRYTRTNGAEYVQPYYVALAPNRGLKITPHIFTSVLPLAQIDYDALTSLGAYHIGLYGTASDRTETGVTNAATVQNVFRGYAEGSGRFQIGSHWSASGAFRLATDRTFLRRYDISRDDLLRSTARIDRIDDDSYFAITGWAFQTLRVGEREGLQPIALPEIDYRRRVRGLAGGVLDLQVNTLAITRSAGQDTQRAFTSATWTARTITPWGQDVSLTGYLRGDVYNSSGQIATTVLSYRGNPGFEARGIAAAALDIKWPFVGSLFGGTQRLTPRVQIVLSPKIANLNVPNEDSRAVDLEDSNLFALNRFPGYDRFEGTTRVTYGLDWTLNLSDFTLTANVGQSYRLSANTSVVPEGTGFADALSDIVGRTELRWRDFVALTHRYRLHKDNFATRRNELDATVGSRETYLLVGYLRLNRQIASTLEDLRDREEIRVGGRVKFRRFWSAFGSTVIDLTTRTADPLSVTDGFAPVRHRIGIAYEDDGLKLGFTWRRDYQDTGDARRGNSYLLTLAFTTLGR